MIISLKEAYFLLTIPFVIFWLIIFLFSKKTRTEQLVMSLLFIPLGPLSEILYFRDYWIPESVLPINIFHLTIFPEDFIFAFCIAGIGAVVYEIFLGRKLKRIKVKTHISLLLIVVIAFLISFPLWLLGVNSIFSTSVTCIVIALLIVAQRKDLLWNSILSGLGVMLIMFVSYFTLFNIFVSNTDEIFKQAWLIYGSRADIRWFDVPLTEMIWGISWGMMIGPIYEFVKGASRS